MPGTVKAPRLAVFIQVVIDLWMARCAAIARNAVAFHKYVQSLAAWVVLGVDHFFKLRLLVIAMPNT